MAVQINIVEVSPLGEEALQVAVVEGINLLGQQFRLLTDTPTAYGSAQSLVKMNTTGDGLDYTVSGAAITIDDTSIRFDIDSLPAAATTVPASLIPISTNGTIESISFEDAVGDIVALQTFTSLTDTPSSFTSPFELVKINAAGNGLDYIATGDGIVIDGTSIRLAPAGDGIIVNGSGINLAPAGAGMAIDNTSIRMDLTTLTTTPSITDASIVGISTGGVHRSVNLEDVINSYTNFLNLSDTPASFGSAQSLVKVNTAGDGLDYTPAAAGIAIDNTSIRMDIDSLPTAPALIEGALIPTSNSTVHETISVKDILDVVDEKIEGSLTETEFFAAAEDRKRNNAGSGFLEWGTSSTNAAQNINQGLISLGDVIPNILFYGRVDGGGSSRTTNPYTHVNGIQHRLQGTVSSNDNNLTNWSGNFSFPEAPDGTKTYDSATGVVVQHADAATAFEGLITNGDFRNGTSGWAVSGATRTVTDGIITVTNVISNGYLTQLPTLIDGTTYTVTINVTDINGSGLVLQLGQAGSGGVQLPLVLGLNVIEILSISLSSHIFIGLMDGPMDSFSISSVSVMPSSESVITTRKDIVFLETWHEVISEKDIVVPLGNVQYGAGSYKGISLTDLDNIGVPQTYSSFGQWDASTQGRGSRWSTLTPTQKATYIADPENNIYFDSVVKAYIQVRYRIRVIEGNGDTWGTVRPTDSNSGGFFRYSGHVQGYVKTRGKQTHNDDFIDTQFFEGRYAGIANSQNPLGGEISTNTWVASNNSGLSTTSGHNGLCFATPIALVQRLNVGAYHPEFNPEGCSAFAQNGSGGTVNSGDYWYDPIGFNVRPTNTADCFNEYDFNEAYTTAGYYNATGFIDSASSTPTGRVGNYEFYDAIYAGLVEDLRLNANKLDINRLLEDTIRNDVTGNTRGIDNVPFTTIRAENQTVYDALANNVRVDDESVYDVGQWVTISTSLDVFIRVRISSLSANTLIWDASIFGGIERNTGIAHVMAETETGSEYDKLAWVDIIGHPSELLLTFPNGIVGQWIPMVITASNDTFILNRKLVDSNVIPRYRTVDYGVTWVETTSTVDTTTNSTIIGGPVNKVELIMYETLSHLTERSSTSVAVGNVNGIFVGNDSSIEMGNRLTSSLVDVGKSDTSSQVTNQFINLSSYNLSSTGLVLDNKHMPVELSNPVNESTAVKALYTLVELNGLLYMQYNGSEMIWEEIPIFTINDQTSADMNSFGRYRFNDPTGSLLGQVITRIGSSFSNVDFTGRFVSNGVMYSSSGEPLNSSYRAFDSANRWGDDSIIHIVDDETLAPNMNGTSVKRFCHRGLIPIGIANSNQTN